MADTLNRPIIMTALLGRSDFAWLDSQRRQYYPAARNLVPAHLSLFHHLPPQALAEIKATILELVREHRQPAAYLSDLIRLEQGTAYQVYAPELLAMRMAMAARFHGLLSVHDQQRPKLHITIQNKAAPGAAKALYDRLNAGFEPRPLEIRGLGLQYYVEGRWQHIGEWPFRGRQSPGLY